MRTTNLFMLAGLAVTGWAQAPDRAARPDEWGYRPAEGSRIEVNPPALTWVHDASAASYTVQWSRNPAFRGAETAEKVRWPAYTHNRPLPSGRYYWRYRFLDPAGRPSSWSRARSFVVPAGAAVFPQPSLEELRQRVPRQHPRLFVRREELPSLREWARRGGKEAYARLMARAGEIAGGDPTPEPKILASLQDPNTNQYWWSNRMQAHRACQEAEVLSFAWLMTGERKYGDAAKRFVVELARWDPDGPTNFKLNCEAAKPMLHRLARAYDWSFDVLNEDEREAVRRTLLRRAMDAWKSSEVYEGVGHLNRPYSSHGNRTWHKLAENAIATLHETPESERFLDYAVTKFFAAYPVWCDDDGGWHEGMSYYSSYLSKLTWWMDVAQVALGIDPFKKPFFRNFGAYPLYTAPPGSPEMGFGDLSHHPPSARWTFMQYFIRNLKNPHWAWWAEQWGITSLPDEPVAGFLWSRLTPVPAKPPTGIPPSKVFRGIGVAVLNSNLLSAAGNVQFRLKASPFGRRSHGHDPNNAFTLTAYGDALLVNNVYRDIYGSPFHAKWCWETVSQNAVLVNGEGQKRHSADLGGRIVKWDFQDAFEYVAGDAAASYEGKLERFHRHVFFVKPDLLIVADDLRASRPGNFQWMLHGLQKFAVDEGRQTLRLDRERAGVLVEYVGPERLAFRQWTGYEPQPDHRYLSSIGSSGIPNQWHVEAATRTQRKEAFTLTILRPHRAGSPVPAPAVVDAGEDRIQLTAAAASGETLTVELRKPNLQRPLSAVVRKGRREWRVQAAE